MQRQPSTLKLPKIDDLVSQKGYSRYQHPSGVASAINSPNRSSQLYNDSPERVIGDSNYNGNSYLKGMSSDKIKSFNNLKDDKVFADSSAKQNWMLKNMEAQRDNLQKRPQYLGIGQTNAAKATTKVSQLNQMLGALPNDNSHSPGNARRRYPFEDPLVSKSLNASSVRSASLLGAAKLGMLLEDKETLVRKPSQPDNLADGTLVVANGKNIERPGLRSTLSRNEKIKFPSLNSPDAAGANFSSESEDKKVNMELIVKIDEKIKGIFEGRFDRARVTGFIKEYFELFNGPEAIQVEAFFVDMRVRKNVKSYLMLEKISIFALLSIVNEESFTQDINSGAFNSICNYLYSNFLNFVDAIVTRLELIPRHSNPPGLESLQQISRRKVRDIDRSFGLEQINKLLLKAVRSYFKNAYKKGDRFLRLDLLMEKIDFGLIINYFDNLKAIFSDLINKFNINTPAGVTKTAPPTKKTPVKPQRPQPLNANGNKRIATENSARLATVPESEVFLPPPVPRTGRENKPIYSLVLDMDETLIHFEEVAGRGRFFVRPYAEEFLKEMAEHFEITVFTAGVQEYADAVLNILDPNKYITHRLYRHHVTINEKYPGIVKDLSKIGRELSKTILVDNVAENFRAQMDNGIEIISWYNDPYDTELVSLIPFLKDLVENQVEDVRTAVKLLRDNKKFRKH